jgi:UDP-N-acetylmuramyl pentapeptide phosphotransferase/UDP-N-acetylglucosamine-1-phosphate transferase
VTLVGASIAASAVALMAAGAISGAVAWAGPVDRPRERGSHHTPTPTSGGLGILAGACAGLMTFAALAPATTADVGKIAAALGLASALGLLGALDDLFDFGAKIKFLAQVALALLFSIVVARIEAIPITGALSLSLGPVVGVIGTALWLVVVVNAVNFMDGANGLAPGAVAIALFAFAFMAFAGSSILCGAAALTAALAGLGFMPWNFPKARLFQGDAGALFSGFLLAELAVIAAGSSGRGPVFVLFAPLALLPFLVDVLLTLLVRTRAKQRLFDAHSDHLYQRWLARHGRFHQALAWRMFAVMGVFAAGAVALGPVGCAGQLLGFVAATIAAVSVWVLISRRNPPMEH